MSDSERKKNEMSNADRPVLASRLPPTVYRAVEKTERSRSEFFHHFSNRLFHRWRVFESRFDCSESQAEPPSICDDGALWRDGVLNASSARDLVL